MPRKTCREKQRQYEVTHKISYQMKTGHFRAFTKYIIKARSPKNTDQSHLNSYGRPK